MPKEYRDYVQIATGSMLGSGVIKIVRGITPLKIVSVSKATQVLNTSMTTFHNGGLQHIPTFFPDNWSKDQVVKAINEAYSSKLLVKRNIYTGVTQEGMKIEMYLYSSGKIISAYPKY